jgi:hypothetical protein
MPRPVLFKALEKYDFLAHGPKNMLFYRGKRYARETVVLTLSRCISYEPE